MTETNEKQVGRIAAFYDELSAEYDVMTSFEKRFASERPYFHLLVDRYRIKSAIDAGCGTGFHALLLAQLGVSVTAIDISARMLKKVEEHARTLSVSVRTVRASFEDLTAGASTNNDAVFSLGNSLAHVPSLKKLLRVFRNFHALLKADGVLVIQVLNYDRIMMQRERVQNSKEVEGKTFERYYEYAGENLVFNIRTIDRSNGIPRERLASIPLLPVRSAELRDLLIRAAFEDVTAYGGISLQEFVPGASKDLVLIARKSGANE